MNWENLQAFIAMGGYAGYVWPAFIITFVLILLEVVIVRRRKQSAIRLARLMAESESSS